MKYTPSTQWTILALLIAVSLATFLSGVIASVLMVTSNFNISQTLFITFDILLSLVLWLFFLLIRSDNYS